MSEKKKKTQPGVQPEPDNTDSVPVEDGNLDKETQADQKDRKMPELEELQKRIEQLEKELKEEKELDMRVRAEYDNYRKRTSREMGEIASHAKAEAMKEILPIADNIDRALSVKEGSEADIRKGVEMIRTQMNNAFQKLGIEEIAEENIPFDPERHNAVIHDEDESLEQNMVVQVLQKGYRIGDRILRYAMVKVVN